MKHIYVAQFYFETIVSESIYVSYGILLSCMGMYVLFLASCLCGKNVLLGWNGYFHV